MIPILAVKLERPGEIHTVDIPEPSVGEGDALIRVKSAGICGSDIGAYRGANALVSYPRVIGHEIAGEVIRIPENFKGIVPGDHVVVDPYLYCGHCYPCSIGRTNCCESLKVLGVQCEGGMAELFAHPADMLVKIPQDMDWDLAALAEPLTIALHGLHRAKLVAGEYAVISGAGPIGLLAAMAAIHYGAVPIVIDLVGERLEKAKSLGVTHTICLKQEDAAVRVREITGGSMAQVVMEASGAGPAVVMALELACHAGRIILTGWPKGEIRLDTGKITKKELDVRGARTSAGEFEEAIHLIYRRKVDVAAILTKVVPAEQIPEMVREIEGNPGNYLKVNGRF